MYSKVQIDRDTLVSTEVEQSVKYELLVLTTMIYFYTIIIYQYASVLLSKFCDVIQCTKLMQALFMHS